MSDALAQAVWDAYGIMGFDQDGDETPAAVVDLPGLIRDAAREMRKDYDDACAENDRLRALLTAPPDDDEIDAGARVLYEKGVSGRGLSLSWDDVSSIHGREWYTERATEMLQGFQAVRARKIGNSDE